MTGELPTVNGESKVAQAADFVKYVAGCVGGVCIEGFRTLSLTPYSDVSSQSVAEAIAGAERDGGRWSEEARMTTTEAFAGDHPTWAGR